MERSELLTNAQDLQSPAFPEELITDSIQYDHFLLCACVFVEQTHGEVHGQHVTAVVENHPSEDAVGVAVVALAYQSVPQPDIHLAANRGQRESHKAHSLSSTRVGPVSFYKLPGKVQLCVEVP